MFVKDENRERENVFCERGAFVVPPNTDATATKGHTSPSSLGVKMWWTPDRGFADSTEVIYEVLFLL